MTNTNIITNTFREHPQPAPLETLWPLRLLIRVIRDMTWPTKRQWQRQRQWQLKNTIKELETFETLITFLTIENNDLDIHSYPWKKRDPLQYLQCLWIFSTVFIANPFLKLNIQCIICVICNQGVSDCQVFCFVDISDLRGNFSHFSQRIFFSFLSAYQPEGYCVLGNMYDGLGLKDT